MSARKRVARFLKAYWPIGEAIGKYDGHPLFAGDLEKLIADSKEAKQLRKSARLKDGVIADQDRHISKLDSRIAELEQETAPGLPELDTEPLEGVEEFASGGPIVLSKDQYNQLVRYSKRQTHTDPQGTRWEWIRAGERTGYAARIDELRSQLETVKTELETARQNIAQWNGAEERWTAKEKELREKVADGQRALDRESEAWRVIPVEYRAVVGGGGLVPAVKRLVGALTEKAGNIDRLRAQTHQLRLHLRDAQGRVAPERNGSGPDGATAVQRWFNSFTQETWEPKPPEYQIHTIAGDDGVVVSLTLGDIEATLRQLNEARALADKHKRAAEKLQQFIDVLEHLGASITETLSQLPTDPDE